MLLPQNLIENARANAKLYPWAAEAKEQIIRSASTWLAMSDEQIWSLMFGPTITRAWMVWGSGHCPSCLERVPMYNWRAEPLVKPWKISCPHCQECFPKNDFEKFYKSGLDERSIFDAALADRSLLFNTEHPDPNDPLHRFGVDDGEGYVDGDKRWRFIGNYLKGHWKSLVVGGIHSLAQAYVLSGDPAYAHKAAILLDRVADLYPSFNWGTQGWAYDDVRTNGYVSVWHDACGETWTMVVAYDSIRQSIAQDTALTAFLSQKSRLHKLANPKANPADICRNIEEGLIHDPMKHKHKIMCNYPGLDLVLATMHRVLGGPAHLAEAERIFDRVLEGATAVDGVTGEKGLDAYSAFVIQGLAGYLAELELKTPGTLGDLIRRHPNLSRTFRFFIDTWVDQRYYPHVGDTGAFACETTHYMGVTFTPKARLAPSMYDFLWRLYEITGDVAYVQVIYQANDKKIEGLPYDLFAADPEGFTRRVAAVIAEHGPTIAVKSVDFQEWHLAIIRSGKGPHTRTLWLDYDRVGGHGHGDGLNLGLYAKGLDLMPDMGYPAVQFGGWGSNKGNWYRRTEAHNTVVIDQTPQADGWGEAVGGHTTLWALGDSFRAVRASAVAVIKDGLIAKPLQPTGPACQTVGLYSYAGGAFESVKVYTKPDDAGPDAQWELVFSDDFKRSEIGPDWEVSDGVWSIVDGKLVGTGYAMINRKCSGRQKIEVIASTSVPVPCDLAVILAGGTLFMGIGCRHNTCWRFAYRTKDILKGVGNSGDPGIVEPGRQYHIEGILDGDRIAHVIDGRVLFDFTNTPEYIRRHDRESSRGLQFERTAALIDLSDRDSYILDIFRVVGGHDHAKFQHSHFGSMTTQGLSLQPGVEYGKDLMMCNYRTDPNPPSAWSADWKVDDRLKLAAPGADIHLGYTDLTAGAAATTCDGWVVEGSFDSSIETSIPRIMLRRQSGDGRPLASTFVAVIEPYEGTRHVKGSRRLELTTSDGRLYGDAFVCVEVALADGRRDLILAADVENALEVEPSLARERVMVQAEWGIELEGEMAMVRLARDGSVERIVVAKTRSLVIGDLRVAPHGDYAEIVWKDGQAKVMVGEAEVAPSFSLREKVAGTQAG